MTRYAAALSLDAVPVSRRASGWRAIVEVAKATLVRFFAARADMLSGALAYFTVLSLAPLLMLAVAIVGFVYDEDAARQQIVADLSVSMGEHGAAVVDQLLRAAAIGDSGWKLALGLTVALWGSAKIFGRLQDALNDIWSVRTRRLPTLRERTVLFLRKRAAAFVLVVLVGVLLFASMTVKSVLAGVHGVTGSPLFGSLALPVLEAGASIVLVTTFVALLYKWLPDVELRMSDVWLGAVITSLLCAVSSFAISAYLGYLATSSLSGAAGGVLVLLLWIYFTSQFFLFGAEFTRAHTEWRRGPVLPESHAESVPQRQDSTRITEADAR